jgi:2-polyprenyl-6-hydroxyphenyl methylase/3-demethylubiquinone-9 3-methyltransferase
MPSREYHEALWESLPCGLQPPRFHERLRFLLAHVQAGRRVLDLGCGEGRFALELARAGVEVLAAEVAQEPLRRAREAQPELDTSLLEAEGEWRELEDSSFDAVWAGEVIEHVADTARWLSEVRRVLRPRGTLLLSTPEHDAPELLHLTLSPRARAERLDPRSDHLRFYTRHTLSVLIAEFGFEDVEVARLGGVLEALRGRERTLLLAARRSRF